MYFKPMGSRVVLRELPKEEKTKGGIIIPETIAPDPLVKGEVMSKGKDATDVKVGDIVLFSSSAGTFIEIEDQVCKIVLEENIVAVL